MNFAVDEDSPAGFCKFAVICQEIPSSFLISIESIAADAQCNNHKSEEVADRNNEEDADKLSKSLSFSEVSNHKNQFMISRAARANAPNKPDFPASGEGTIKLPSLSADSGISI